MYIVSALNHSKTAAFTLLPLISFLILLCLYTVEHLLNESAWKQFIQWKLGQRAGYAPLSNIAQIATFPCLWWNFPSSISVSFLLIYEVFFLSFFYPLWWWFFTQTYPGLLVWVKALDLTLGELTVLSAMILFSTIEPNSRVWPGSMWHCQHQFFVFFSLRNPRPIERNTDQGSRMFLIHAVWLLIHSVKSGCWNRVCFFFFSFSQNYDSMEAGRVQESSAILGKKKESIKSFYYTHFFIQGLSLFLAVI